MVRAIVIRAIGITKMGKSQELRLLYIYLCETKSVRPKYHEN